MKEPGGTEFRVVCTDRGQHARVNLRTLIREGDAVTERLAIRRQHGLGDEVGVSARTVDRLAPSRQERNGEERWRWQCPRCRRDVPLSGANLRLWMDNTSVPELDVSLLP